MITETEASSIPRLHNYPKSIFFDVSMKVSDPEMVGKPKNHYVPGYDKVKHHEWRTAENSAAYLIPVLKDKAAGRCYQKRISVWQYQSAVDQQILR